MKVKVLFPFVKKSLLFILFFLTVVFCLELVINFAVKKVSVGEYGLLNKIDNGNINADIIISGTSRALKAINPKIIEKDLGLSCYNLASDGSDLGVQFPKFKWYLTKNTKPKILIQDVSQFGGSISPKVYQPYKYLPYLSNDELFQGLMKINSDLWFNKYFFPINLIYYNFDFYVELLKELIKSISGHDKYINGFLPDESKWSVDFEKYKKANPSGISCSMSKSYKYYLQELSKFCKNQHIILILVALPNYYRLSELTINQKGVQKYYKNLGKHSNVIFLDFSNSQISKNNKNFYNFSHLNIIGANKLTNLLSMQIKRNLKIHK